MPVGSVALVGLIILTWGGWMDRPLERLGAPRAAVLTVMAAVLVFHMVAGRVIWGEWLAVGVIAAAFFGRPAAASSAGTVRLGWLPLSVGMMFLWQPLLISGADPMWVVPLAIGLISGLAGRCAAGALRLCTLAVLATWCLAATVLDQALGAGDLFQWSFGGWSAAWVADALAEWISSRLHSFRFREG